MRHSRLIARLVASDAPILTVFAPVGYGKTSLIAQWSDHDPRSFAWIAMDPDDNDPAILYRDIADAMTALEPSRHATRATVGGRPIDGAATVMSVSGSFVLVCDDVDVIDNAECLDALITLGASLPKGSRLALVGRDPVLAGRLDDVDAVQSLGVGDLAMGQDDVAQLMRQEGITTDDALAMQLAERTEGWPAALRLAATSIREGWLSQADLGGLRGDDRLLADYLRSGFLARLTEEEVAFMTKTSVLEAMSGPLCDALLDRAGSEDVLASFVRRNALVVADEPSRTFRYHPLLRDLLRAELFRAAPGTSRDLNGVAAVWFASNGEPGLAVGHAQAAEDVELVERLVVRHAYSVFQAAGSPVVEAWFDWLTDRGAVPLHPGIAGLAAWVYALRGRPVDAERLADLPEPEERPRLGVGVEGFDPTVAIVRVFLARDTAEDMGRQATDAIDALPQDSRLRPMAKVALGIAHLLAGRDREADVVFAEAAREAERHREMGAVAVALAERCVIALRGGSSAEAEMYARRSVAATRRSGNEAEVTSALGYAVAARCAIQRGEVQRGRGHLQQALGLRPLLTYALPTLAVQTLLELARAHVAIFDVIGARVLLRDADQVMRHRPQLAALAAEIDALRSDLETSPLRSTMAPMLTAAELRLLPRLETHLSFREIGEQLFVSPSTVKTQAISIYRKLGVTSRSAAVSRAADLGLLSR